MDFEELYNLHSKAVFRFLFARTRDRELAADLTQDVFAWALARPPDRCLEDMLFGDQRSHLLTKARSALIDDWRREARRPTVPIADDCYGGGPEPAEISDLLAALDGMPDDRHEIICLRYWGGLSYPQIAVILGCKPKTANQRGRVAHAELRQALQIDNINPAVRDAQRSLQVREN